MMTHADVARPPFEDLEPGATPGTYDVVELKADGRFAIVIVRNGTATAWSRHGKQSGSPRTISKLADGIYLGEHIFGTNWAKRSGLDDSLWLFDLVELCGEDMRSNPLETRRYLLKDAFSKAGASVSDMRVRIAAQYAVWDWSWLWTSKVYMPPEGKLRWEGLIFKRKSDAYGECWGRMKKTVTQDYVCMGRNPGGGRYAGVAAASIIGGLYVNGKLAPKCSVMGINDQLRYDIWEHPEKYIGRVFEAEGKELFATGALRHPNFKRWRDDKPKLECTWPQGGAA